MNHEKVKFLVYSKIFIFKHLFYHLFGINFLGHIDPLNTKVLKNFGGKY